MLLRRVVVPTLFHVRSYATMTSPQNLKLDRTLFNQTSYANIRDFWFKGLSEGATAPSEANIQRWYGVGATAEEKTAFDNECRDIGGAALESLGPSKLTLPTFESYESEIKQGRSIAGPLLAEVETAQKEDSRKGSDTLLSLILLLDQLSRNTLRDNAGLRLIYTHYDRLAFALLHSSFNSLNPNPVKHEAYIHRPVIMSWFLMPLMHSEHLPSHELYMKLMESCLADQESSGDEEGADNVKRSMKFEEMHLEPLRKFGRFPHRNECLGRQTTEEEKEHLKSGQTFGVKQGQKDEGAGGKDEL